MNKNDAETEAVRLWRELPKQNRSDHEHAIAFAELIAKRLPFETVGDHDKIVAAWLLRDLQRSTDAAKGLGKARSARGPFSARAGVARP